MDQQFTTGPQESPDYKDGGRGPEATIGMRNRPNMNPFLRGMKTVRRFAVVAVLVLSAAGLAVAPASASSSPTSASTAISSVLAPAGVAAPASVPTAGSLTYHYPVYQYQVCRRQGHWGASFTNYWNPYSWYCYDLSFPLGITWAGGLDINGWCKATYPGSYAGLDANNAMGWKCIKRIY
ncbi:UNVERIFIED_ORG: hypothetical protein J2X79_001987 [Arthrobacter globiformis]|nr:hypothetical protein [Arthrobacter globiformis]